MAQIPGAPQRVVLDLAPDAAQRWTGSMILPGRGVKGAPLADLRVDDGGLRFSFASAFGMPSGTAPEATLKPQADGALAGEWRQAGHAAPLRLVRTGTAQVDPAPRGTAISAALEGTWIGRYELGGVPRDVTLTLANGPQGTAGGELVIVGKRTTRLTVDRVEQGREYISVVSSEAGFRIEGRWATADGRIDGQMSQGPFEAPLTLRRSAGARR